MTATIEIQETGAVSDLEVLAPYDYQDECLEIMRELHLNGRRRMLVAMAGGLGKTLTAAFFTYWWFSRYTEARCLFLCHQNDILIQAQKEFRKVFGDSVTYGFFNGDEKTHLGASIVFASFQTMHPSLAQFDPEDFSLVWVDEGHRSKAETFERVILKWAPELLVAITATPDRHDRQDIREIYGEEVFDLPLPSALAQGKLTPVRYKLVTDDIVATRVVEAQGRRFSIQELNRRVFIPRRDEDIVANIKRHMTEFETPCVIIFCASIKHCENIAALFDGDAVPIHGGNKEYPMPIKKRRLHLDLFRAGSIPVAVTVDMFNEALDVPKANILCFLRNTDSMNIFYQQLSRGLRRSRGKTEVLVLDYVGNCERLALVIDLSRRVQSSFFDRERLVGSRETREREAVSPFTIDIDQSVFTETVIPLLELI